ncbi:VOC family protein [Mucilaginibacter auburnensis]|uniref:Catechol 2,3-dioxygenase-like lactoylglutathione lyase family enzyme n=1 Tax=Mucilaginibacter auburnensis TaxID=1457233 RepID=A0A2H9VNF0_9SPHI|nr:VOC family protein [Mucilaginibacter auburnensis]PJJ79852.1 catechol 2,3-dioxygenase-like lactoylglutathione lyase family enzyme [Mucilaginibacter auburnensis]
MKLRVARHTSQLQALIDFYTQVLGLKVIGGFKDHAGYDGVFIGGANSEWHLEFTQSEEPAVHQSDEDDLLVFYLSAVEYSAMKNKLTELRINLLAPKNPYWAENGLTIADPDGFRIVLALL